MERVAIKMRDGALETLRGSHWPAAVLALAAASSFCVGLIALRIVLSGHVGYAFLVWNLALAWVPLVLAVCLWVGYRRDWPRPLLGLAAVAWLLFLPNAPYILTDYVHLASGHQGGAIAFDALAISAYAVTGVLLGFASLYLVQAVSRCVFGERVTWWLVHGTLALSAVGIYLGRYQRLNSWDAIRDPGLIAGMIRVRVADPFGNDVLLGTTISFTAVLVALYLLVYSIVLPRFQAQVASRFPGS
ncbi:MAG: DUF1361 domain-containing protein [Dehalococcoidia bacterium]|nr:DUF1361 domain-containing protein [Dehalococcoidia bacterium]MCB9485619.1 DUF1361 domain-containing protein [Thermoflexaceae bacterium]